MSTVSAIRRAQREPLIDLIYFDAGGGHRASALALKAVVESQGRPWTMRMVNLREVLEPIDVIRRLTGVRVENFYNGMLKHNLTIGVGPMLPVRGIWPPAICDDGGVGDVHVRVGGDCCGRRGACGGGVPLPNRQDLPGSHHPAHGLPGLLLRCFR